jgi:hypothetical protein
MKPSSCILLSTGRAASTAIYNYIAQAGQLQLPSNKEPHYLCDIYAYNGLYDLIKKIHISDKNSYFDLYSESPVLIDGSCGYFFSMEDVQNNLDALPEKPFGIFLYREPVSRAISLYSEKRRKQLTQADSIYNDMAKAEGLEDGLWWEHYYDNVFYDEFFKRIIETFDQVLAVNYDYFAANPKDTLSTILHYLSIEPLKLDELDFAPLNSSREARLAIYVRENAVLARLMRFFPSPIKRWSLKKLLRLQSSLSLFDLSSGTPDPKIIETYLSESVAEYKRFRSRIGYQDVYLHETAP